MSGRWCCQGLTLFPLDAGRELACSDVSGALRIVSTPLADLLLSCSTLLPLAAHARAAGDLPELERAAAEGLLSSEEDILALARSRPRPAPPAPSALGILTKDRPALLARCLAGFRAPEVVVCDDGATRPPLPDGVRYAGPAEKARYVETLAAAADVDLTLVAFALGDVGVPGFRAGGNRNALYLDLVDRLFVSADDDLVGRFAAPGAVEPVAVLGAESADLELRLFPDREAALGAAQPEGIDVLAGHGALLGRDPSQIPALQIGELTPGLLRRLRRDGVFVAVTMAGILGDCGNGSASWMLTLDPSVVPVLAGSDALWEASKRSREILRVARRPVLSDQPSLMTYFCGFDGRALLPPFLPFGRNEDAVFAYALQHCVPGALIGHLPWAVLHAPGEARPYAMGGSGRPGIGDLVLACMASIEASPGLVTAEQATRRLGRHLRDLAVLGDADYDDLIRRLLWNRASSRLDRLELERKESPGCGGRALDLTRAIETLQASLLKPESLVPADLPGADLPAQRALARSLIRRYGELLDAWPALVAAARGLRLSVPATKGTG